MTCQYSNVLSTSVRQQRMRHSKRELKPYASYAQIAAVLYVIKPPGLTLEKDESNECVSGINVRPVTKRREGKAAVRCIVLVSRH
jgi:hypothetical protein